MPISFDFWPLISILSYRKKKYIKNRNQFISVASSHCNLPQLISKTPINERYFRNPRVFLIADLKVKMDLHTRLPLAGIMFMLCCGFVHCDTEDATENGEYVMTHAPIVSDSPLEQHQTTIGGGDYRDYQEDDNMYLFGDFFNKQDTDDNQNVAPADDRSATQSLSVADSHTVSNNVVQVTESPDFIEDSEEAYDLEAYDKDYGTEATQTEATEGSSVAGGAQSDGKDSTETSGRGSSSSSGETKQSGSGDNSNGNSNNGDSKSSSENSGSSSSGTDDNRSGENGKDDRIDAVDVENYNNLQGSASSEDSSYSDENSGESSTKKKNCKCKKNKNGEGADFGSDSSSDDSSDDSSEDQSSSSGSGSGNRDTDKSREGNYGDKGDSSSDESDHDSYDSEEYDSSSESTEEPDKPDIPDHDKQRTGNGIDRSKLRVKSDFLFTFENCLIIGVQIDFDV